MSLTKADIKLETCEIFDDYNYKYWTKKFKYKGIIFYISTLYYGPTVEIGVKHQFMEIEPLNSNVLISDIEDYIIMYIAINNI